MAPNPVSEAAAMKRTSTVAGFDMPASTKQRRRYHHFHKLAWRQKIDGTPEQTFQNTEILDSQLVRAISLVLDTVGFKHADPAAMESFRMIAQEYMAHVLSAVRQSMLSARRVQPTPHDFLSALNAHELTLTSLLPHIDPPIHSAQSQPPLYVELPTENDGAKEMQLIGEILQEPSHDKVYIPPGLPTLPSRHTYKAEPVYARRDMDPKEVRERATEEGRLGEEALRRLVGSQSRADNHMEASRQGKAATLKQQGRDMWKETMAAELKGTDPGDSMNLDGASSTTEFDEYSIRVNADSIYWRKAVTGKKIPARLSEN